LLNSMTASINASQLQRESASWTAFVPSGPWIRNPLYGFMPTSMPWRRGDLDLPGFSKPIISGKMAPKAAGGASEEEPI